MNLFTSSPTPLLLKEKGTGVEVFGSIPRRLRRLKNFFTILIPRCCGEEVYFCLPFYKLIMSTIYV